jgi:hypothetical protein
MRTVAHSHGTVKPDRGGFTSARNCFACGNLATGRRLRSLTCLADGAALSQVGRASGTERHYASPMAQSRVPDRLQPLVDELRQLAPEDRSLVLQATNEAAPKHPPTVPWSEVEKLIGIVNIGGNAVDDCEAIYDDV